MPEEIIVAEPAVEAVVPDWLNDTDGFSDILADEASKNIVTRYDSPASMAKGLIEKEKTIRSGFKMPETLSDEQMTSVTSLVNKARSVPEKPEEYEFVRPSELDEDIDLSEKFSIELRAYAKTANIGKGDYQALSELLLHGMQSAKEEAGLASKERVEAEQVATEAKMQQYYGPAEYERVNGLKENYMRSRAVDDAEYDEFNKALDASGLRHNPLLNKLMGDGSRMREILEGNGQMITRFNQGGGLKAQSAEAKRATAYPNTPQSLGGGAPG